MKKQRRFWKCDVGSNKLWMSHESWQFPDYKNMIFLLPAFSRYSTNYAKQDMFWFLYYYKYPKHIPKTAELKISWKILRKKSILVSMNMLDLQKKLFKNVKNAYLKWHGILGVWVSTTRTCYCVLHPLLHFQPCFFTFPALTWYFAIALDSGEEFQYNMSPGIIMHPY